MKGFVFEGFNVLYVLVSELVVNRARNQEDGIWIQSSFNKNYYKKF